MGGSRSNKQRRFERPIPTGEGATPMNSKLMKAGIAGAAVVALAAGGSTFAAWSDFTTWTGNNSGAGTLTLSTTAAAAQKFVVGKLTPGQVYEHHVYLLSNKSDSTPNGTISLALGSLVGQEGGCGTGNQVALDDTDCASDTVGEFINDAKVFIKTDASNQTDCDRAPADSTAPAGFEKAIVGSLDINGTAPATEKSPAQTAAGGPIQLSRPGTVSSTFAPAVFKPGEGVCMDLFVYLPKTVNNEVQNDSATFNLTATLNQ